MTPTIAPLPNEEEISQARESGRVLSAVLKTRINKQELVLHDDKGARKSVRVPASALLLLKEVLVELGRGNAVSITPLHAELTTQEAADLLNVSRPFLVQLLEKGELPFHKTGTHRRVRYQDVISYKQRIDARRRQSLSELSSQAQDLDMGY